jgi:hypothetical protein
MKAIVLTYDRNELLTDHMIRCYDELWFDHPFTFIIPYQNQNRCKPSKNCFYVKTNPEIKSTILTLLENLNDEEWIYWCIDDKYPIELKLDKIKDIYNSIINNGVQQANGILFCRHARMLDPEYLTDVKIQIGNEILLERKTYHQIWIHQFVQVKIIRHLFNNFPDKISIAREMDGFINNLIKPNSHKLFVTERNCSIFGESTFYGELTINCRKSLTERGLKIPDWFETNSNRSYFMGTFIQTSHYREKLLNFLRKYIFFAS